MRSWRNSSALLLSVALATACAASKPRAGVNPDLFGSYRFEEQLSPDSKIEGTFVVGQDSVAIDAYPGPCRYERDRSNVLAIVYIVLDMRKVNKCHSIGFAHSFSFLFFHLGYHR